MSVSDGGLTIQIPTEALAVFTMIAVVGVLMLVPRGVALFRSLNAGVVRAAVKAGFRFDPTLTGFVGITWLIVFATLLAGLFTAIVLLIFQPTPRSPDDIWSWRFSLAQIAALTAVLGAIIALPFTIMRLLLNRRQTETAEQGMITDRINKAVEGLGAEKTVTFQRRDAEGNLTFEKHDNGKPNYAKPVIVTETRPNLEVRIGAIYALERIAQDSDRDHVQIMEILCAYIRENAPAKDAEPWPELDIKDSEHDGPLEEDWDERLEAFRKDQRERIKALTCRTDIQAALTVIGRRSHKQRQLEARKDRDDESAVFVFDLPCPDPSDFISDDDHDRDKLTTYQTALRDWKARLDDYTAYRLDLRKTNLRGADLSGLNLSGAQFNGSELQGADLGEARMQRANLREARMQGANLANARMQGVNLAAAQMQLANLTVVQMQGAGLGEARMQGANLWAARMQGTYLEAARMQGANLWAAQMQLANLWEARVQGTSLGEARMQGTSLGEARMQGANLWGARMQGTDVREARMDGDTVLTAATLQGAAVRTVDFKSVPQIADHLEDIFGDGSVPSDEFPDGVARPAKWPKFVLEGVVVVGGKRVDRFTHEWRKWQKDPDYTPPEK